MAHVHQDQLAAPRQRWKHLKWWKKVFWKSERQAHKKDINKQL